MPEVEQTSERSALILSPWIRRFFGSPWLKWDVNSYRLIALRGYLPTDGTSQFHPFFPWLATPLARIMERPVLGLILISSLAALFFLVALEELTRLDYSTTSVRASTLLLIFSPLAMPLLIPYSEGLFLLWAVLSFYYARQGRWWGAGLTGALAVLTRQQGILLWLPLLWELWEAVGRDKRLLLTQWLSLLALGLLPSSLLGWIAYRELVIEGFAISLESFHSFIYSAIITPSASQIVPEQKFVWPWRGLWLACSQFVAAPDLDLAINLILASCFLVLLVISWRKLRISYRIYVVSITVVSFSYYTGPVHPYMGLPRHLLLAFPVFMGLGEKLRRPWQRLLWVSIGSMSLLFLLLLYFTQSQWVP